MMPANVTGSRRWRGDLLALAGGSLLPLAFAPVGVFPLAPVALAMLFAAWLAVPPRRALWRGMLFGLGLFGVGASWIFVSIYYHGHVSLPLSLFLTALFVGVLSLFPAVLGYFTARFFSVISLPVRLLLVFPATWTLFEWLRSWFLTGFPWLSVGYSQVDAPLVGLAPLFGLFGLSWATAATAGLLLLLVLDTGYRRKASALLLLLTLWGGAWLLQGVQWSRPQGEPIQVSLIQGNIPQDLKWQPQLKQPTLDLYADLTRQNWKSDLIVWPETAVPAFYDDERPFLDALNEEARLNNSGLLIGLLYRDKRSGRYYNSMVSLGGEPAFYHKSHLVPFTEYLPLKGVLGGLVDFMNVPMSDFAAGGDQPPLKVAGQKVALSICYEGAFGDEVIGPLPEAGLLVNVSNDAWFDGSMAPFQHLEIVRMRALETGRPLVRATNTGISAIIDAQGKLQQVAPRLETAVLTGEVQPMSGATPYVRFGNLPVVLGLTALLLLVWRHYRILPQGS